MANITQEPIPELPPLTEEDMQRIEAWYQTTGEVDYPSPFADLLRAIILIRNLESRLKEAEAIKSATV